MRRILHDEKIMIGIAISSYKNLNFFFFVLRASTSSHSTSLFSFFFFGWVLLKPELASNLSPPDLFLLSS
jgi:hypothetical protein